MILPQAKLKQLTEDGTVEIRPDADAGIAGGSGFFVTTRTVVTCAHVVADGDAVTATRVNVRWLDVDYAGYLTAQPAAGGGGVIWPYPDLCVIELDEEPPEACPVLLGDLPEITPAELYFCGYTRTYTPLTSNFATRTGTLDGRQDIDGGRVRALTGCEMAPGTSGGPTLDPRAGVVCGIAKTQRLPDSDMGGLVIPATAIRDHFPDVWERNHSGRPDGDLWVSLGQAVRDISDPLDAMLGWGERRPLTDLGAALSLRPAELSQLYRDIAGDLAPQPSRSLANVTDVAAALADLTEDGLDWIVRLFAALQQRRNSATDYAALRAARLGQDAELAAYRSLVSAGPAEAARPVIVVRLDGRTPRPAQEVLLDIWSYRSRDGRAHPVDCEPGPHAVRRIDKIVMQVLAEEIEKLPPYRPVLIEFALPDRMLDTAVERWVLDDLPLGDSHAVVIRSADRKPHHQVWRARSGQFRSGQLPPQNSDLWKNLWFECMDSRTDVQLNGMLQANGRPPVIAMTAWHRGKPLPLAVKAAMRAGAPVVLWRHRPCPGHRRAAANGSAGGECRGTSFRNAVSDRLAGVRLYELPEEIWQLRAGLAESGGDDEAAGIAILWDDPDRVPWRDGLPSRDPSLIPAAGHHEQ
jgi:vWA-MoxR associated protein C-terminal domain/Trypsin-like peptidase domain